MNEYLGTVTDVGSSVGMYFSSRQASLQQQRGVADENDQRFLRVFGKENEEEEWSEQQEQVQEDSEEEEQEQGESEEEEGEESEEEEEEENKEAKNSSQFSFAALHAAKNGGAGSGGGARKSRRAPGTLRGEGFAASTDLSARRSAKNNTVVGSALAVVGAAGGSGRAKQLAFQCAVAGGRDGAGAGFLPTRPTYPI